MPRRSARKFYITCIVMLKIIKIYAPHFQDELGLNRELMFKLPMEKRWELYLSKQKVA